MVTPEYARADDGDSNFAQNLTYHGSIGDPWRRLYLSPQQLKDFAQRVEEVAKKFPREVVRIKHTFSHDWDGDPAIYFKILFTDEALRGHALTDLTRQVRNALVKDLALYESEYSVYIPYFNFRTKAEQDRLKDPQWE